MMYLFWSESILHFIFCF